MTRSRCGRGRSISRAPSRSGASSAVAFISLLLRKRLGPTGDEVGLVPLRGREPGKQLAWVPPPDHPRALVDQTRVITGPLQQTQQLRSVRARALQSKRPEFAQQQARRTVSQKARHPAQRPAFRALNVHLQEIDRGRVVEEVIVETHRSDGDGPPAL